MSASNHRNKAYNTYHHLGSRIAHRVYFLREDERNEFVDRMFRVAAFTGVELVGWCIMTNHFHIMAYLPRPVELDEEEVLHRYSILKGKDAMHFLVEQFKQWRATPGSEALVGRELVRLKSMMYSIAWFMKIIKQWTTEEYNRRYSHKGTLWEATYFDRVVDDTLEAKAHALGYVHLNPIRAAASAGYDDYPWSSFTALHRGSVAAIRGMRRVYGDDASVEAMSESHIALMDDLLEEMKRKRAVGSRAAALPDTRSRLIPSPTSRWSRRPPHISKWSSTPERNSPSSAAAAVRATRQYSARYWNP